MVVFVNWSQTNVVWLSFVSLQAEIKHLKLLKIAENWLILVIQNELVYSFEQIWRNVVTNTSSAVNGYH